jgi:hypothetical protein
MGAVWTHGMSEGVAGMNFNSRAIEYNPEKDEFISVGKTAGMLSFSQNRYVLSIFDSKPSDNPDYSSYVVSVQR